MGIMKYKILTILLCFFVLIIASYSNETASNKFPEKSIELIVAFTSGAATDTQARIISKYANKYLGQEIVIINKPGGGGQVGWNSFSTVNQMATL
jgi:tripartite-type tricarboxylate transporter receptor subunit TctC